MRRSPPSYLATKDCGRPSFLANSCCDDGLVACVLVAPFLLAFGAGADVQHRGGQPPCAGQQPGDVRGEFGVGAFVHRQQQSLEICDEALLFELLALQPCLSSLLSGSRDNAARNIGGIAMVVRIAMVTIIENMFWLSTPIESPMVAIITSVDPHGRAFRCEGAIRGWSSAMDRSRSSL